mmetsp:Transcript_33338/g.104689  ORF Transcript_33338/g.104689 Transcript_33338/m.104689 type:complete len:250 (-) Transcript_33338:166-915(-)
MKPVARSTSRAVPSRSLKLCNSASHRARHSTAGSADSAEGHAAVQRSAPGDLSGVQHVRQQGSGALPCMYFCGACSPGSLVQRRTQRYSSSSGPNCGQSGQQPTRSFSGTTSPEQLTHEKRARSCGLYQLACSSTTHGTPPPEDMRYARCSLAPAAAARSLGRSACCRFARSSSAAPSARSSSTRCGSDAPAARRRCSNRSRAARYSGSSLAMRPHSRERTASAVTASHWSRSNQLYCVVDPAGSSHGP